MLFFWYLFIICKTLSLVVVLFDSDVGFCVSHKLLKTTTEPIVDRTCGAQRSLMIVILTRAVSVGFFPLRSAEDEHGGQ